MEDNHQKLVDFKPINFGQRVLKHFFKNALIVAGLVFLFYVLYPGSDLLPLLVTIFLVFVASTIQVFLLLRDCLYSVEYSNGMLRVKWKSYWMDKEFYIPIEGLDLKVEPYLIRCGRLKLTFKLKGKVIKIRQVCSAYWDFEKMKAFEQEVKAIKETSS